MSIWGLATEPASDSNKVAETCLKCHGPFAKLAEKTATNTAPSGETTTPHRHIPHDTVNESTIPNCESCHQQHPVPPNKESLARTEKPKWDYCYEKCHHQKDFTHCKTCHPGY